MQFGAAGDDFESQAADELGVGFGITPPPAPENMTGDSQTGTEAPAAPPVPEKAPQVLELTPEQKFEQACAVRSPIKKHDGKTLGEVLQLDPGAISWLANKFTRDETVRAAAEFICSYSMAQATA